MRKRKANGICGVYEIVNLANGCRYIGSSVNLADRYNVHFTFLKKRKHFNILLQQDYDKFGREAFLFFVLERCTKDTHFDREEFHLNSLRDSGFQVYNIGSIKGGDNLTRHPNKADIVRRIAKSRTGKKGTSHYGETNPNWRGGLPKCRKCSRDIAKVNKTGFCGKCIDKSGTGNSFYGRTHSEETRNRISVANLGKKPPNTTPIMVNGIRYESLREAGDSLGLDITTIRHRVYSKNIKYKDWYPFGQEKDPLALYTQGQNQGKKIVCDSVFFESYSDAARHYGLSITAIENRVRSKNYPAFYFAEHDK